MRLGRTPVSKYCATGSGSRLSVEARRFTSRCWPAPVRKRCTSAALTAPNAQNAAARSDTEPPTRVGGGEGRAHAVAAPPGPEVVAAPRALELDHVGTEVGHEGGAVGAGDHPGEVENADAAEHAAEYNPGPLSVWYRSGGKS